MQTSELSVNNGVPISDAETPSVVLIIAFDGMRPTEAMQLPDNQKPPGFICTATYLSEGVVLTAAHCVTCAEKESETPRICKPYEMEVDDVPVARVLPHPKFKNVLAANFSSVDMAILFLEKPLARPFAKICKNPPKKDDDVILVGYGADLLFRKKGLEERSGKYVGSNKIESVDALGISLYAGISKVTKDTPLGVDASLAIGDSGGPLIDKRNNCILGVASQFSAIQKQFDIGEYNIPIGDKKYGSHYANLFDPDNQRLLEHL